MLPPPPPLCAVCGVPLAATGVDRCTACLRRLPAFASARAAALYTPAAAGLNPVAIAIRRLKYDGRRPLADALGTLLAERYPFPAAALVVPVPLHLKRLRSRGFNQAVLLAGALARRRGLPCAPRALIRTRATRAQPGLVAAERRANLDDAFVVRAPTVVARRHVVLVDDVLTTGATAEACARALVAAGAARVDVYTVGRVP